MQPVYSTLVCLIANIITSRTEATPNVVNSNADFHQNLQEMNPSINDLMDIMEDVKRAWKNTPRSGWKKRSWQDLSSSGWGKRGWQDLQTSGWGKRGWQDLQTSGWGKRGWQDLQTSGWGKRAWQNLQLSGWGKRAWKTIPSSGWRKRASSASQSSWENNSAVALSHNGDSTYTDEPDDIEAAKSAWNRLRGIESKRDSSDWGSMKGAWGKRDPAWHNLKGLWGKRSPFTNNADHINSDDFQGEIQF